MNKLKIENESITINHYWRIFININGDQEKRIR